MGMLTDRPHMIEKTANRRIDKQNVRTSPNRFAIHPVSGCMTALAMEYALMAMVPSVRLTPRLPEIVYTETLTMEMSNTSIKVASATAAVSSTSVPPDNGCCLDGADDLATAQWLRADRSATAGSGAGIKLARIIASA